VPDSWGSRSDTRLQAALPSSKNTVPLSSNRNLVINEGWRGAGKRGGLVCGTIMPNISHLVINYLYDLRWEVIAQMRIPCPTIGMPG
jgi:hypothetical protein